MKNYTQTMIEGTFDRYETEAFTYQDGTLGERTVVVLTNARDLKSGQSFAEIRFNLAKGFKALGHITDHPRLRVNCRQYEPNSDIRMANRNHGYAFPKLVTLATPYAPIM